MDTNRALAVLGRFELFGLLAVAQYLGLWNAALIHVAYSVVTCTFFVMAAKPTMGELIITFVAVVLGLALTPTVGDSVAEATGGNITGISATLLELVPVFWVLMIMSLPIVQVYRYFRAIAGPD